MYKPSAETLRVNEEIITSFKGYNRNYKIEENEFSDETNMTGDYSPVISPRNKRVEFNISGKRLHGLFAKNSLGYINNGVLYYGGYAFSGLSFPDIEKDRQFVSLGAKLLIFPDKVYINTNNLSDYGSLEAEFITPEESEVSFSLCNSDGTLYENYSSSNTPPVNPLNSDLWVDTSVTPNELKQYSEYLENWVSVATTYVKISFSNIGKSFKEYDSVKISGCEKTEINSTFTIYSKTDDYIVITALLSENFTQKTPLKVERKVPSMDFFCENGNRVWGCSSETNEIYCCKLGDPTNWQSFMGIASDSFSVSVGSDGEFTGGISYKGYCLFFKENCVHKIYGSNPPFTVNTNYIRGVQKGSEKSLVPVNETLYYKAPNGIVMYDGGLPISIFDNFSDDYYFNAVAGNFKNKYYVCMTNKNNKRILFNYDELKNIWHKEDEINIKEFVSHNSNLYFIAENNNENKKLYLIDSKNKYGNFSGTLSGFNIENNFSWNFETGLWGLNLPNKKYYSNITIRAIAVENSSFSVFFQYNSNNNWVKKGEFNFEKTGSINIPFITPRCDHLKIKIEGIGDIKILSIFRKIEKGSEK